MNTEEVPSKEEIQRRKNELRAHHQPLLDAIGVPLAYVVGKMEKYDGEGKPVVFLFPSELERGDDVYVEFTTRYVVPTTNDRKLYRWKYNPFWVDYPRATDADHRLVPFDQFTEVVLPTKSQFSLPKPGDEQDAPFSEMTIRDYAALTLCKPVSLKPWLNQIVIESQK